jgi:hypothetical protein
LKFAGRRSAVECLASLEHSAVDAPGAELKEMNMTRMLLRDRSTGLFYVGRRQWTFEIASARDFPSLIAALQVASTDTVAEPELVFVSSGSDVQVVWDLKHTPVSGNPIKV